MPSFWPKNPMVFRNTRNAYLLPRYKRYFVILAPINFRHAAASGWINKSNNSVLTGCDMEDVIV